MDLFSNPADKITQIAASPKSVLGGEYNFAHLVQKCQSNLSKIPGVLAIEDTESFIASPVRPSPIGKEPHQHSWLTDLCLIFKRFMLSNYRNPMSLYFFACLACIMAFLEATLYFKIGRGKFVVFPIAESAAGCWNGL